MRAATARPVDPVLTEVVRNGLVAITEEMKTILLRSAYNMIIYEALDFTVGLFTARGETVSIGLGLPMFIRGMSETVKAEISHFGIDGLQPGDVLLTNDAYITGSHLNHMTFSVPIFDDAEVVGFAAAMAHWQDVGGALNGITTDIFSEGLQMPMVKIHKAGVPDEELLAIIRSNVRLPESAMGDLRAQIAAVKAGERRYVELLRKHGRSFVLDAIDSLMDQSEAHARASVRSIPNGTYEASAFMDDDGVDVGTALPIKVRVVVQDESLTVDLSEVSPQVAGFFNSGHAAGVSAAQVAFKCLTSPSELPINDGAFRPLRVILPEGRLVSAEKPAAMRWWMTVPMTVVDLVFRALSDAIPARSIAGHHADLVAAMVNGYSPKDGRFFLYLGGLVGGGWGAKQDEDGISATVAINDGDTHNPPTEQIEAKFPVRIWRYGLRPDSGGPGKHRGGLGVEQECEVLTTMTFNAQVERVKCKPWGLAGGLDGAGNEVLIRRVNGDVEQPPNGKLLGARLNPGDRYILRSGGGGGFGPPTERDRASLAADVAAGYVSESSARHIYGYLPKDSDGREATPALEMPDTTQ